MRDFLLDLEGRLESARPPGDAPLPQAPRRRLPAVTAGAGGLAAAIVAVTLSVTLLTGTSRAELPILETDPVDASAVATRTAARHDALDFTAAHVFGTPSGPGYAVLDRDHTRLCLVVPDHEVYGMSCSRITAVQRRGLLAQIIGQGTGATALAAFVLPAGAHSARIVRRSRTTRPARVESGVVTERLRRPATLTYVTAGHTERVHLSGPFAGGALTVTCPDGHTVEVQDPASAMREAGAGRAPRVDPARVC